MGFWSNVLKIGGIAAAPWTGGASLALTGAGFAMDAQEKAVKAQEEATDKALDLNKEMFEQTRADLEPYRRTGNAAMGTLGALMGLPVASGDSATSQDAPLQPATRPPVRPDGSRDRRDQPIVGRAVPRPAGEHSGIFNKFRNLRDPVKDQTSSGFVRMQAPTGEQDDVPAEMVPYFESQGARRMV